MSVSVSPLNWCDFAAARYEQCCYSLIFLLVSAVGGVYATVQRVCPYDSGRRKRRFRVSRRQSLQLYHSSYPRAVCLTPGTVRELLSRTHTAASTTLSRNPRKSHAEPSTRQCMRRWRRRTSTQPTQTRRDPQAFLSDSAPLESPQER